jgi:3-oxoacyl-[acyl-carrier protein] reductase
VELGIQGKVALVTAASRGLGRGAALGLARERCRVAICARDPGPLRATAAELGDDALAVEADVTDPEAPRRLVGATLDRFGALDILVANAGGPPKARSLDVTDEGLAAALNANLMTSIRLVREAVPYMRAAGWGRIVLITSNAVQQPIPDLAYSNTARTALWAWAKTAAVDLMDAGVTVNLVCPGLHDTERVRALGHQGRKGDPEDFGRVVAFLCSASAAFVSGVALRVDGASTLGLL